MDHFGNECCYPFGKFGHASKCKVFPVTEADVDNAKKNRNSDIEVGQYICKTCRQKTKKKVKLTKSPSSTSSSSEALEEIEAPMDTGESSQAPKEIASPMDVASSQQLDDVIGTPTDESSEENSGEYFDPGHVDKTKLKTSLNGVLEMLNLKNIDETKMRAKSYQEQVMTKLINRLCAVLFPDINPLSDSEEMIKQLKEKFDESTNRATKIKVLSVLPKSWSGNKIKKKFAATQHMIYQTKKLVEKDGILCDTTKKIASHVIPQETIDKVKRFYRSENISRPCPGIREYVRRKDNGQVEKIQRRLILVDLKEAFELFKTENPELKIGFSKFADVRPEECVLAGSTHGIHTTCVCVYHQNVKLIFDSLRSQFNLGEDMRTWRDLMKIMHCDDVTEKCRLNECENCPGIDGKEDENCGLRSFLSRVIDDEMYENISFKQWNNVGSKFR